MCEHLWEFRRAGRLDVDAFCGLCGFWIEIHRWRRVWGDPFRMLARGLYRPWMGGAVAGDGVLPSVEEQHAAIAAMEPAWRAWLARGEVPASVQEG